MYHVKIVRSDDDPQCMLLPRATEKTLSCYYRETNKVWFLNFEIIQLQLEIS